MKIIIEGNEKKINQLFKELNLRCKSDKLTIEKIEEIEKINKVIEPAKYTIKNTEKIKK